MMMKMCPSERNIMSKIGQAVLEQQEKDDQNFWMQHEEITRLIQTTNAVASDCGRVGAGALVPAGGRDCGGIRAVGGGVQRGKD